MATNGGCTPQSAKPPRLRTKRKSGLHLIDLEHNFAEVAAGSDVRIAEMASSIANISSTTAIRLCAAIAAAAARRPATGPALLP